MNSIYFQGFINEDSVSKFILEFNKLNFNNLITVYLNSEGGLISNANILKDILSINGNVISLVASGNILSCAFDLFFDSNVLQKRILPFTIGMTHQGGADIRKSSDGKVYGDLDNAIMEQLKFHHADDKKLLKSLGITDKELNDYIKGEDVFFKTKRLKQMLQYAEDKDR